MSYCAESDVLIYATPHEGVSVADAIIHAQSQIEMIAQDFFEPHNASTVEIFTNKAGVAYMPATTRAVTSVADRLTGVTIPAQAMKITTGKLGSIRITPYRQWNILIVGMEPWRLGKYQTGGITLVVTADLGTESTPIGIKQATAMLAGAFLINTGQAIPTAAGAGLTVRPDGVQAISVEGYSATFASQPAQPLTSEIHGTGYAVIDRLIAPYRRQPRSRWY